MKKKQYRIIFIMGIILLIGLCLAVTFVTMGSGLTLWFGLKQTTDLSPTASRPTRKILSGDICHLPLYIGFVTNVTTTDSDICCRSVVTNVTILVMPSPTLISSMPSPGTTVTPAEPLTAPTTSTPPSPDTAVAPTSPPVTPTSPPLSPETAMPTPLPATPTPTPLPPTATPPPPPPPPTATEMPTATPTPAYTFTILETEQFPTNHLNFDVYIAITDANNTPLSGYRVLGQHSDGLQVESQVSANAWTANSGAMHYKAGNIKYEVPNSPGGVWTLQLVDEADHPVAPPVELSFDSSDPSWHFVLYRQIE